MLHENIKKFMEGFQHDHPMGIFLSTVGALDVLSRRKANVFDKDSAASPDLSPHREGAEHRGVRTATASAVRIYRTTT
jgi:hypothetical protein